MPRTEPLPFRLPTPGRDTVDFNGVSSVSYRIEGFLHLRDGLLTLEWTGIERTQEVAFSGIRDHVDSLPLEWVEVPVGWITDGQLRGRWWRPRLEIRVGRIDAFDDVPGASAGSIHLRIRRRDRALAVRVAAAIQQARTEYNLTGDGDWPEIAGGDVTDGGQDASSDNAPANGRHLDTH